jgi:predicted nucleic acid-binding protein
VTLVIDSSITLAWCFEDEGADVAVGLLNRVVENGAVVSGLWRLEVANGLQVAVRRGRIDRAYRDATLADLCDLAIEIDAETEARAWTEILHLADRLRLTVYDAAYLELAQRRRLPLATLDKDLVAAGKALGVDVVGGSVRS